MEVVDLTGTIAMLVEGRPIPWERPKRNRAGFVYNPQAAKRAEFGALCQLQMPHEPLSGQIRMEIDFYFKRPGNHYKRNVYGDIVQRIDAPRYCSITRDIDNLGKFVLDALNGIAYNDDRQVVRLTLTKRYSDRDFNDAEAEYTSIHFYEM